MTLHARWIRHDFAWDAIEPQPGVFTWSGFDRWVGTARADGLNVIATISYTPAWANGGNSDHDYEPSSPQGFGQFAGEVAARYSADGVHTYEIWNEPNIVQFWKPHPSPAKYEALLAAAYTAIHKVDPAAVVITGGSSPAGTKGGTEYSPPDWLSDLYAGGAQPYFDGASDHPYVDSVAETGNLGGNWYQMADSLRPIMEAHGDASKPIWATEVGCNVVALGDSECARRIASAFKLWRGYSWAAVLCWFTYWDPNVYGMVDSQWKPRPPWYAFQAAAAEYG